VAKDYVEGSVLTHIQEALQEEEQLVTDGSKEDND
jgi:glycerol-3-phosphate acyltransferase PlsX